MAKLAFDYVTPIERRSTGNEIDPKVTINVGLGLVQGVYYERTERLDTGEVSYGQPIAFTVQLTPADMESMLAIVKVRAEEQDVLRPATPVLEVVG